MLQEMAMEETILESTQWIMEMDAIRKSKNAILT